MNKFKHKKLFSSVLLILTLLFSSAPILASGSESIVIHGSKTVFVPDIGSLDYHYSAFVIDSSGNPLAEPDIAITVSDPLPDGVTFSPALGVVTVSSAAEPGESFDVCALTPGEGGAAITVTTGKNYIENGDFEDLPVLSGYHTLMGDAELLDTPDGKTAILTSEEIGENLFVSTLSIDKTHTLLPGDMYVLRALIYSDPNYTSRQTEAANGILQPDGVIDVNINSVGSVPVEIMSVVEVSHEGVFQINLNFINGDERPVYISWLGLYKEIPASSDIIFNAPAHITMPQRGTLSVPVNFAARDQAGNILAGEALTSAIEPLDGGVSLSGKTLFVSSTAREGEYTLFAYSDTNPNAVGSHIITISSDTVGDGGFETRAPGQWFSTAAPSQFNIVSSYLGFTPPEGVKFGKLTFEGNVSAILSDSVFKYEAGVPYVLDAYIKKVAPDIETVLTAIIYNSHGNSFEDNLSVLQIPLGDDPYIRRVFVPSRDITGRLMLGFTTPTEHDSQVVLMDDIKILNAFASAENVSVSGYPYPSRTLTGKYRFTANFETQELSAYRWLMSSERDGVYMPIEGEVSEVISITEPMLGKHLKFEVTPSSLSGPVFGESVMSGPIQIISLPSGGTVAPVQPKDTANTPEEDIPTVMPNTNLVNRGGLLGVINIFAESFMSNVYFYDIQNHWAKDSIDLLSAAGIANGRGNLLFEPDALITRAEFSAFLMRSFSLAPLKYTDLYADVNAWNWHSGVVETVTKYNISQGVGNGYFAPDMPITREQMTVMIIRAMLLAGVKVTDTTEIHFTDAGSVNSWALESVRGAFSAGLVSGFPDGHFYPQREATRAEAISMIQRMLRYIIHCSHD